MDIAGTLTFADMVAAASCIEMNANIVEANFPVDSRWFDLNHQSRIFQFKDLMTTTKVLDAMRTEGYAPDSIERLFAYSAALPRPQIASYFVVSLGSSVRLPFCTMPVVPVLIIHDIRWRMDLRGGGAFDQWAGGCRFLASPIERR